MDKNIQNLLKLLEQGDPHASVVWNGKDLGSLSSSWFEVFGIPSYVYVDKSGINRSRYRSSEKFLELVNELPRPLLHGRARRLEAERQLGFCPSVSEAFQPFTAVWRARCLLDLGRGDEAERTLGEALIRWPGNSSLLRWRARARMRLGRFLEAASDYAAMASDVALQPPAFLFRAHALDLAGHAKEARQEYAKVLPAFRALESTLSDPDSAWLEFLTSTAQAKPPQDDRVLFEFVESVRHSDEGAAEATLHRVRNEPHRMATLVMVIAWLESGRDHSGHSAIPLLFSALGEEIHADAESVASKDSKEQAASLDEWRAERFVLNAREEDLKSLLEKRHESSGMAELYAGLLVEEEKSESAGKILREAIESSTRQGNQEEAGRLRAILGALEAERPLEAAGPLDVASQRALADLGVKPPEGHAALLFLWKPESFVAVRVLKQLDKFVATFEPNRKVIPYGFCGSEELPLELLREVGIGFKQVAAGVEWRKLGKLGAASLGEKNIGRKGGKRSCTVILIDPAGVIRNSIDGGRELEEAPMARIPIGQAIEIYEGMGRRRPVFDPTQLLVYRAQAKLELGDPWGALLDVHMALDLGDPKNEHALRLWESIPREAKNSNKNSDVPNTEKK